MLANRACINTQVLLYCGWDLLKKGVLTHPICTPFLPRIQRNTIYKTLHSRKCVVELERSPNHTSMIGLPTSNLQEGRYCLQSIYTMIPWSMKTLLWKLQLVCLESKILQRHRPRRLPETVFLSFIKNKLILTTCHYLDFSQLHIQKSNHTDIKTEWHIPKY